MSTTKKILILAGLLAIIPATASAVATTEELQAAISDLSKTTGVAVTTEAEAGALCDQEQYLAICAEVGKRHNLYEQSEIKEVDTLLEELKGKTTEDLQKCESVECLGPVANDK